MTAALYVGALTLTYALPSAVGNNIIRLGISFGLATVVMLAWEGRRWRVLLRPPRSRSRWRSGCRPPSRCWVSPTPRCGPPTSSRCCGFLRRDDRPLGPRRGRADRFHWEAAYVAPYFPLARGWERQLDTANNALFYVPGRLNDRTYRAWLFANGVRFVALPDVPLDYAALAEGEPRARRRAGPAAGLAQRALARLRRRSARPGSSAARRACSAPTATTSSLGRPRLAS